MSGGATVLVTGGGGFVGLNLARAFRADGARVHATVRPGSDGWRLAALAAAADVHEVELVEPGAVVALLERVRPTLVVHAAVAHAYRERDFAAAAAGSVSITANLIEALRRRTEARLLFAGSGTVYGSGAEPRRETDPLRPASLRGAVKAGASLLIAQAARHDRVDAAELRLFTVYGPWEEPRRLVPTAIHRALDGRPLALTATDPKRDLVYVDDVADAFLRAARRPAPWAGRVWNVGSGVATSNREIVMAVERALGVAIARDEGSHAGSDNDLDLVADPARAAAELGWRATTSLAAGLAASAGFWRERLGAPGA